jgi:hypothetical protein
MTKSVTLSSRRISSAVANILNLRRCCADVHKLRDLPDLLQANPVPVHRQDLTEMNPELVDIHTFPAFPQDRRAARRPI